MGERAVKWDRGREPQEQRKQQQSGASASSSGSCSCSTPGEVFEISQTPATDCLRKTEGWTLGTTPWCFKMLWRKTKTKKHRLAESQLLTAASDVEQEGETQGVKSEKEHACGTHTWRPLVDFNPKRISTLASESNPSVYLYFCKPWLLLQRSAVSAARSPQNGKSWYLFRAKGCRDAPISSLEIRLWPIYPVCVCVFVSKSSLSFEILVPTTTSSHWV